MPGKLQPLPRRALSRQARSRDSGQIATIGDSPTADRSGAPARNSALGALAIFGIAHERGGARRTVSHTENLSKAKMHESPHSGSPGGSSRLALVLVTAVVILYLFWLGVGGPQRATERIVANNAHTHADEHDAEHAEVVAEDEHARSDADHVAGEHDAHAIPPSFIMVLPFACLLGSIAVLPLIPATAHWWENNLNRFLVGAALATIVLTYYLLFHAHPVERHFLDHAVIAPNVDGPSWQVVWTITQNAILNEYIPFIVLLFSLYTIAGGIRVEGDLQAAPITNTIFIAIGGLLASFIGTTGAAMLLIRPLLETNHQRRLVAHTVVFFIFVVCNCGGLLTPLGDPPLFLGYLQGVDFLWTFGLWRQWLFVNGALLATYFLWDRLYAYPRETKFDVRRDELQRTRLKISGAVLNGALLGMLILSVALLDPSTVIPGTDWHPWLYLREAVQLTLVAISLAFGSLELRAANRFNYGAILEVAALFFGIFICMQPALQILEAHGSQLGIDTVARFFWATGFLSSVLDNAPTYLVFLQTARSLPVTDMPMVARVPEPFLAAISLGAVFMGAMTYIGNGPNFMVKAIAEAHQVRMPSFFGYLLYSGAVLLPILVAMNLLFH